MMNSIFKKALSGFLLTLAALSISNCQTSSSDSGSSSSYSSPSAESGSSSLSISSKVSIVEAQEDSTYSGTAESGSKALVIDINLIKAAIERTINPATFAAGSDYNQDVTEFWVHEDSIQAFNTVNEILCSIAQSKYDDMVGQGNYRAQIDVSQCSSSNDNASEQMQNSQNQSSSSGKTEYENWVVNSSRETDQPHIVKVWINETASDEHDMDKMIMAKLEIYRSPTSENPFGYFALNFMGYPVDENGDADTTQDPVFKGYMRTVTNSDGETLLQFSNNMSFGPQEFAEQATFSRSADGSSGAGTLSSPDFSSQGAPETQIFNIAYNADNFLRQKESKTAKCYDRDDFKTTIWDYSMYDSAGARVQIDSGFPIKYVSGSDEFFGWVGYHGLWMPDDTSVGNGDTVFKQEWNNNVTTETEYTVFQAGGRLMKHTRQEMTLGELVNVPLQWHGLDQASNTYVQFRIVWNGSTLQKTAILDEQNWSWTEMSPAEDLDLSGSGNFTFHFWSEALGGSGSVNIMDNSGNYSAPGSSTPVIFHVQDMVYPTDTVPASLACFDQCPDPDKLADSSSQSLAFSGDTWFQDATPDASNYHQYNFDSSTMVLQYEGADVVMTQANQSQQWGFHSGMLFEPSSANLSTVACDWDSSQTCNWQAWDRMTEYYTWETGPESWNKFTAIKNTSNQFEKFDAPMKVTYTHAQTDSSAYDYKYNGSKFVLEYGGFGNLHGIPGRCIDRNTGATTSCNGEVRWVPEFSIKPGVTVANAADSTIEYVIKPLHGEQRMSNVDLANCSSLSLTTYELPGISDWVNPAIGSKPVITDAPAVIGGVVQ
jgi:hypothetical protein